METKNIVVGGVWVFVTVWLVGMLMVGGDLLWALILFFIAVGVSFGVMGASTGFSGKGVPGS